MSKCISMHGEYSDCAPDQNFICTRCTALDEDALFAKVERLSAELAVAWDAHGHLLTQNDELRAALTRVEARCENAEDNRRWLTAFEIRDALKALYAEPS